MSAQLEGDSSALGSTAGKDPLRVCYVSRWQFGHMVPTYYNCLYLAPKCDLRVITLDKRLPRYDLPDVRHEYVPYRQSVAQRWIDLILTAVRASRSSPHVVLVEHFSGCGLIPLLSRNPRSIVDIRTGSVAQALVHRLWADSLMRWDASRYPRRAVISEGLRDRLRLPIDTARVIPLGAVERPGADKDYSDGLRLLYVGTLYGRRIEDTLHGLADLLARSPSVRVDAFEVVGSGFAGEESKLRSLVKQLGLGNIVRVHGFIHQLDLDGFYADANVGIAYIPRTNYYDVQPPTKTFEYLLAGMPVIATATSEHRRIIHESNGVLVDDSAESFSRGLEQVWNRARLWRSADIRDSVRDFSWQRIVDEKLWPFLQEVAAPAPHHPTARKRSPARAGGARRRPGAE